MIFLINYQEAQVIQGFLFISQESEYAEPQEIFSQAEQPLLQKRMRDSIRAFLEKYSLKEQEKTGKKLSEYLSGTVNVTVHSVSCTALHLKNASDSGVLNCMI